MAVVSNSYTGNGSTTTYSFTFPYLNTADVKVKVNGTTQNTTSYTLPTATTLQFNTAPSNGSTILIFRDTNNDAKKATFYPGSAIKAEDLNNDFDQILYTAQEVDAFAFTTLGDDAMQGDLDIGNNKITNLGTPTAGTDGVNKTYVDTNTWDTGSETYASGETWTGNDTTIATSGAIDARIDSKVDTAIEGDVLAGTDLSKSASSGQVTINHNVTEADSTVNNSNGNVLQDITVTAQGHVTSVGSTDLDGRYYTETELDGGQLDNRYYTETQLDAGQLDTRYYTESELNSGQLDNRYYTETEVDANFYKLGSAGEIASGEAWSAADNKIATTAAIDARITDLVDDVGGFVPIDNETSFPNTNPDVNNGAGTLVSIKALSSNFTSNGSGVATIANGTVGNSTVTITGLDNSTTYSATYGMIVETTTTLNTYTFHRLVPKATEVTTVAGNITNINAVANNETNINAVNSNATNINTVAGNNSNITTVAGISSNVTSVAGNETNINAVNSNSSNINTVAGAISNVNTTAGSITNVNTVATNISSVNDFSDVYRISSSDPSSHLHTGDLVFNTTSNELRVYNGSSWQGGVTATGGLLAKSGGEMTGNITFSGSQTVDGRDISTDGTKLDGIESNATADMTGAQLKTAYEGESNTNAYTDAEKTKLSGIATSADQNVQSDWNASSGDAVILNKPTIPSAYTHPNHSGEVTSTGDGATVIADNIVDEANLKVSNSPTNGYVLTAQSGNTGGLTWAAASDGTFSNENTYIGADIATNIDSTPPTSNAFFGYKAGENIYNGSYNVGIGWKAYNTQSYGNGRNVAVGASSLYSSVSGYYNTAVGDRSLYSLSSGYRNVAIGKDAGLLMTTGRDNELIGYEAGKQITSGLGNTLIGYQSGTTITTAYNNICIGYNAQASSSSVNNEITIGHTSMTKFRVPGVDFVLKDNGGTPTTGQVLIADSNGEGYWGAAPSPSSDSVRNTLVGTDAGDALTNGSDNTIVGYKALENNTWSNNTAVGAYALNVSTGGINGAFGMSALRNLTTGSKNTALGGYSAGQNITTGIENTLIGTAAGTYLTTEQKTVAVGYQAMSGTGTGEFNTAVGYHAMYSSRYGAKENTAIGHRALFNLSEGNAGSPNGYYNTAVGSYAGDYITSGHSNTCIGRRAGDNITTGDNNICIGYDTEASSATVNNEITIGDANITKFRVPGVNFILKDNAGTPSSGQILTADGSGEGYWADGGLQSSTTQYGYQTTSGGTDAAAFHYGTAFGYKALENDASYYNCAFGHEALNDCTSGQGNSAFGYKTLEAVTTGLMNIGIGAYAAQAITTGSYNIGFGYYSNRDTTGSHNISMGSESMGQAQNGPQYNIAIGYQACRNMDGNYGSEAKDNTCVGTNAGTNISTGSNNLFLGHNAGFVNSPTGSITTSDDLICLGDSFISALYCADTTISSSDKRDKTDITDFTHGLKWVEQLKPVTYRWDKRVWYNEYNEDGSIKTAATRDGSKKRARQHIGFLAQDVLAIEQADGFASKKDDMLVVNLNEDDTAYGLKYERLVPVLVNAIKELSAKVKALEAA